MRGKKVAEKLASDTVPKKSRNINPKKLLF
jgi:hypothetical protein